MRHDEQGNREWIREREHLLPPPAPKRKRDPWNKAMSWIMGGVAGVVLLVWAASCASPASSKPAPRFGDTPPTAVVAAPTTSFRPPPTLVNLAPPPQADPVPAPAPAPADITVGDGTYEVGAEITPGKYKSEGTRPGEFRCYWARLKGDDEFGDVITNHLDNGPTTVVVKASDKYFKTQGCVEWVKQAS
jgi:hypothetical protein